MFYFKNVLEQFLLILFSVFITPLHSQIQPDSPLMDSFKKHSLMKSKATFGLEWIQVGPTLNGSRAEAVQADPNSPGTIYTAFGSGGLWKTTNNGLSWNCIFENMPSLGIGDFALAPSNPNIIYVATGESLKKARNFTMPGVGIYKSVDAGDNWEYIGLPDTWHVGEIVVHPKNPDIVLVAALGHFWTTNNNRGIFRTDDGGKTWSHVLYVDNKTGANDIVFSAADPEILFATLWENYPGVNGANSGVYKSENGGKTWSKTINGITIDENTGRIGVATSYSDKDKAYIFIDQRNRGENIGSGEIYKTTDGGKHWIKTHNESLKSLSTVGWYFMDLHVNPKNDEELYGLGVRLIHSTDGGKTFKYIGGKVKHLTPSSAQTLHLDQCEMWINPNNPNELVLANDGGVYQSYDKGSSWLHFNNIPTGEFYDIEVDNKKPYNIYGGTQDDSTVFGPAEEYNPDFNDPWQYVWIDAWSGGDGCITLVDPDDENTIYFSMQNGNALRRNLNTGKSVSIVPRFPKKDSVNLKYNFITPYMLSHFDSKTLYMAGNYVMKSKDQGNHWTRISPNLIDETGGINKETAAGALAESYFDDGTLYKGTDRGSMWRTTDGGKNWKNISDGLSKQYIRSIQPSKHKKERVYVAMTGLNYDEFGAYLYVSEDNGETWNSITSNLPNHPVNVILEDPDYENILYVGTYRGVYISTNRGENWSYFGSGLPDASIADLIIEKNSKDFIVATHGRGIYMINLKPFYEQEMRKEVTNYLFDVENIISPKLRDTHKDVDEQSIKKVPFSFWLNDSEEVELNISNAKNSIIWSESIIGKKGLNQFRWNLITKEKTSNLPYFIHYKSYIQKGEYNLDLKHSEGILRKKIRVIDKN